MPSASHDSALSGGRHDLPGYRIFEFTWRGEVTPQFESVFKTFGIRPSEHTGPAFAHVTVIRFDAFLAFVMTTRPARFGWIRERPEARRRYGYLLTTQGTAALTANGVTSVAPEGTAVAAPPSAGDLVIEAHTEAAFVFFSFDANEVRPLALPGNGTSTVELSRPLFRVFHDFLTEATKSPPFSDPRDADVLRSITRSVAISLLQASLPTTGRSALLEHATLLLEANAATPSYTANDVARELGVTRRTLDRPTQRRASPSQTNSAPSAHDLPTSS